ncbi:MAG: LuxR C-terminal-related transcriptional regulator [Solirubrobacterales bacterium]
MTKRAPTPASGADEIVPRERLLSRLAADRSKTLILCAPSGYGKSVLLGQHAERDPRAAHTVLLARAHNDPTVLVGAIADALAASEPLPQEVLDPLRGPQPDIESVVLPRLLAGLGARREPFLLILDELERLETPSSLAVVAALLREVPAGSQLAIASRVEPPLRLGRERASRRLIELRRQDLTMTKGECGALLEGIGLSLTPSQLDTIVRRTEGWPAALYLAGLALTESDDPGRALERFAGDDRVVVDYLQEEFLVAASRHRLDFLKQISVLDRMSGELCDALLEREGSAPVLRELARSNMLLVPLDRTDTWFRFHPLLRDMLRSELRRGDPGAERALHLRASEWWAARSDWDQAIQHAVEAAAPERAGELLWLACPHYFTQGQLASVDAWLARLGEDAVAASAALSLTAAWTQLTLGRGPQAERWAATSRRRLAAGDSTAVGTSLEAGLLLADATLAREGLGAMREAIAAVEPLLDEDDPWRTLCSLLDGVALQLTGAVAEGRERLLDAVRRGSVGAPNLQCVALAQLALIYMEAEDWPAAEREIARARDQIARYGLGEYPMIALVFAVSAQVRARRGATDAALADLRAASSRLEELDHYIGWYEIEARLALALAALRLDHRNHAERLLDEAESLLLELPDGELLAAAVAAARSSAGPPAPEGLTAAELRILQFLPSHLSLPQIAAAAVVSPNTVKTHVRSIYRKFGVSSRQEAIERATRAGLVDRNPAAGGGR